MIERTQHDSIRELRRGMAEALDRGRTVPFRYPRQATPAEAEAGVDHPIIRIFNESGGDLGAGSILWPRFLAAGSPFRVTLWQYHLPSAFMPFAVALELVPKDDVGDFAVVGLVRTTIYMNDTSHQYAQPITGNVNFLESVPAPQGLGTVRIHGVQAGLKLRPAVVDLDQGSLPFNAWFYLFDDLAAAPFPDFVNSDQAWLTHINGIQIADPSDYVQVTVWWGAPDAKTRNNTSTHAWVGHCHAENERLIIDNLSCSTVPFTPP